MNQTDLFGPARRRRVRRHGRQAACPAPPARAGLRRTRDDGADPRPHGVAGDRRDAADDRDRRHLRHGGRPDRGAAWSCGATSTACRCRRTRRAPSTPRSRASCTPAATTCTWPPCSARPRCWRRGARTSRAATSSSSSRPRRRCAGPRRCSSAARSPPWRGHASSASTSPRRCPRASWPCARASPCRRRTRCASR